ncbi:hypothetical protein A3H11_03300 [Candidatus Uhrbacteria bacterium RIFCSPLOWO2_12_FULL_47_10]|nr:MAG: hypothetical protein A3H11_03300 [Candidatus Uhrbacteria bacterium RIFCSPLOWO2_12_FULL_47_10]
MSMYAGGTTYRVGGGGPRPPDSPIQTLIGIIICIFWISLCVQYFKKDETDRTDSNKPPSTPVSLATDSVSNTDEQLVDWVDAFDLNKIERRVFEVEVDPTKTIKEIIMAGDYGYMYPKHMTAVLGVHRVVTGTEPVKAKVVVFRIGRNASCEQIIRLRAKINLGPACTQHLLTLGAKAKRSQLLGGLLYNKIVNPDDVILVDGIQAVLYLGGDFRGRGLGLSDADAEWKPFTWFLGLESE